MTRDAYHRRGEVLRSVLEAAECRRDGMLPLDVPGVDQVFADEVDLVGALALRWHAHLNGAVERALLEDPAEPERAVVAGWQLAAGDRAGLRAVLDRCAARPTSDPVRAVLDKATAADRSLLAALAGQAAPRDPRAAVVGERLEAQARAGQPPLSVARLRARGAHRAGSLLSRLRARLAA